MAADYLLNEDGTSKLILESAGGDLILDAANETGTATIIFGLTGIAATGTAAAPAETGTATIAIGLTGIAATGTSAAPTANETGTATLTIAVSAIAATGTVGTAAAVVTDVGGGDAPYYKATPWMGPEAISEGTGTVTITGPQIAARGRVRAPVRPDLTPVFLARRAPHDVAAFAAEQARVLGEMAGQMRMPPPIPAVTGIAHITIDGPEIDGTALHFDLELQNQWKREDEALLASLLVNT